MELGIQGRTALITGGASDLGRAVAELLLAEGVSVILVDVKAEAVATTASELGTGCACLHCDLRDAQQISGLADTVQERFVMPDIVICAAGGSGTGAPALGEVTDADWYAAWDLDVMSVVRTLRAFVPAMAQRGWGRLVAVTDRQAAPPVRLDTPHDATSAATRRFLQGLAPCHMQQGVMMNTVSPANTENDATVTRSIVTDNTEREEAVGRLAETRHHLLGPNPRGKPHEIAATVVFLCSEHAVGINGADCRVEGGASTPPDN